MTAALDSPRSGLERLALPATDAHQLPSSAKRFPCGGEYRVEIPSVEGPDAMGVVLEEASDRRVAVHRVSQGSGVMLQTDSELDELAQLGRHHRVEVCLFIGPRARWDIGAQASSPSGAVVGPALRGADQLAYAIADVQRACEHGICSVLVADLGLLSVLARLRDAGDLPNELILKVSISLPAANPASIRVLEDLGASSVNVPGDLTIAQLAAMRSAVDVPMDIYVEGPDDFGGLVRHHEIAEIVRVAAPVCLKFGLRNSPSIYPSGEQLRTLVLASARERVRRAEIGLRMLERYYPQAVIAPGGAVAAHERS